MTTDTKLSLVHKVLKAEKPDSEKPPMLLMLHGYGSHEEDLFSMAPMLNEKCTVVSVRAPISLAWGGFAWYEIDFDNLGDKMNNIPQAKESLEKISLFIKEAQAAYGTDPERQWLIGFSQGAILSYALSLQNPVPYSKVMALSGYVLKELVPEKYKEGSLSHLDFFVSHGTMDEVLPVEWGRQGIKVLEQLKISHQYREYPMGHGVNPQCFDDLKMWMRERGMI